MGKAKTRRQVGAECDRLKGEKRAAHPMWLVLREISSSLRTFVDSWTRLRNFCNRDLKKKERERDKRRDKVREASRSVCR